MKVKHLRRELHKIALEDNCTICGAQFAHLSTILGGVTKAGKVALAGKCCAEQMAKVIQSEIHLDPAWFRSTPVVH
jgi:hypothetical protein